MVGIGDLRVSRLLVGFLRLLTGMTQTALGDAARVDQSLLSRYEHPDPARTLKVPEDSLRRLRWLGARIDAGLGRRAQATAALEEVCRFFLDQARLPYDAALAGLDLAVLRLEEGETAAVRELALAMGPIFKAQGIAREALAALTLFCEAARAETATVELARQAAAAIEQASRAAPPSQNGPEGPC